MKCKGESVGVLFTHIMTQSVAKNASKKVATYHLYCLTEVLVREGSPNLQIEIVCKSVVNEGRPELNIDTLSGERCRGLR